MTTMRIIDAHTHFPGRRLGASPRPIAAIRDEFEEAGLAGAWIFTTDGLYGDCPRHNDLLAEAVRGDRDFFVPFCTVDPHAGPDAAARELERCRRDLAMPGVKLHPWLQAFSLSHPAVVPILRRAGELGMPVVFHDGTPPYSTPLQIAAAAEQAPGTAVILGHAGLDDLYEDAILACLRHKNVYLCGCSGSCGYLAEILRRAPAERLLFGSDGGFAADLVGQALDKYAATGAPESLLRRIFEENPRRLCPFPAAQP